MIGYFGEIIFETSDRRIRNFSGFKRNITGRWADQERIGMKPISEFNGPGLDTITFTVNLNGSYGVKPREEMEKWSDLVNNGIAKELVIGEKPLGVDKWVATDISEAWDIILNKGELLSAKIDVSLKEYIEENDWF